jgi:hypothetical protein
MSFFLSSFEKDRDPSRRLSIGLERFRWLVKFSQYSLAGVQTESGMLGALARQNTWSCSMAPDMSACKNVRFIEESIPGSLPQRPKNSNTYGNEVTVMLNTFNTIKPPTIMIRQYDVADRDWTWATGEISRSKKISHIGLSFGS